MNDKKLNEIAELIEKKKINEAQTELSKLGTEFLRNTEYLFLRSKIFYLNKLYYMALDTLLITTEFDKKDKVYDLISEIYGILGNKSLSEKVSNQSTRLEAIKSLKNEVTGISQKE